MGAAAGERARGYAWPRKAERIIAIYRSVLADL